MPDIKNPQGVNVSYDLTKTVAEVMKGHTKPGLKCVLVTGSGMNIEKSNDKLSKIYKPGRVLTLKVFKSKRYCSDYFYLIIILLFSRC